ncbi:glycoside hydrolase family 31 protein [Rhypophila sp. PSN 637]
MPITERPLTHLVLPDGANLKTGDQIESFKLVSGPETLFPAFTWTLEFPFPHVYRIILAGPERPRPPHDNANAPSTFCKFELVSIDKDACRAVIAFPYPTGQSLDTSGLDIDTRLELRLFWKYQLFTEVWERRGRGNTETVTPIIRDLGARPYALTEHGIIRHWRLDRSRVHLGLGEKAAPIDLTGRRFIMHAADSAFYDAYKTDPLYKHTPFLISTPPPNQSGSQGSTYAIFHPTNSVATWDVGASIDYPSGGLSKQYIQDWGGLEEWVMIGNGVQGVVRTFSDIAGKPRLVGRDWLGYLASTVLLADLPNAQEELEKWPGLCVQNDIPCSAMHLSSGYTHDEETGEHLVFYLNTKRYPDFKKMVRIYHAAGMKILPNVKPYLLTMHPDYRRLEDEKGLFFDPLTQKAGRQNLSNNAEDQNGDGSWADFSAPETRRWWAEGIKGLIELGVDGIWDDNNEFFTRDDEILAENKFEFRREVSYNDGSRIKTGLLGRITGTEVMNKGSHDQMKEAFPERRVFILTRSGNPATFKYAASTWAGDNYTSWHNLRGSQHIQINSALSLMQNTGADVGGFAGPKPTPELFVRWVQLGVTHSRFCIHSDGSGGKLNTPWMYPEMLPIICQHIKWRYYILPFLNNLMWQSHLGAAPPNAPLFYGPFASDPVLYTPEIMRGFVAWLGVGQILVAPQLHEGERARKVYFPRTSPTDQACYFDISGQVDYRLFGPSAHERQNRTSMPVFRSGEWATIPTPLEYGGMFAREGAVIPVGRDKATLTALDGPARRYPDGVDVELDKDSGGGGDGQVGLDDWRGVLIFPPPPPPSSGLDNKVYEGEWVEDDGISADPSTYLVKIRYWVENVDGSLAVRVEAKAFMSKYGFQPLWSGRLFVFLPEGDWRAVVGAQAGLYPNRRADKAGGNARVMGQFVVPVEYVI